MRSLGYAPLSVTDADFAETERLFHAARAAAPDVRAALLANATAPLRADVEALLAAHDYADVFDLPLARRLKSLLAPPRVPPNRLDA